MSILIKGMEMPTNCGDCPCGSIFAGYKCKVNNRDFNKYPLDHRQDWCPIIGISEPHGRLIDANAMFKDICDSINEMTAIGVAVDGQWLWDKLNDALKNAPTIIPASEEG